MNIHIEQKLRDNNDIIREYNLLYKSDPITAITQLGFEAMVAYDFNQLLHLFDYVPDDQTRSHGTLLLKYFQRQLSEYAANSFRRGSTHDNDDRMKLVKNDDRVMLAARARFCSFLRNIIGA